MNLHKLQNFLYVVQDGSLSAAAKRLNITQPSLSIQMKELEEELGVTLFYREKKRLHLTSSGHHLVEKAKELLEHSNRVSREIKAFDNSLSSDIWIGGLPSTLTSYLAKEIAEFVKVYPETTVHMRSSSEDVLDQMLTDHLIDIAIAGVIRNDTDRYEYLEFPKRETWGLLTTKDGFLSEKQVIHPEDLTDVPLITDQIAFDEVISPWLGEYKDNLHIFGTGNLMSNNIYLVKEKLGVMIMWKDDLYTGTDSIFKFIPFDPMLNTSLYLKWEKGIDKSPTVFHFLTQLRNSWKHI